MILKKIIVLLSSLLICILSVSQVDSIQNALLKANENEKAHLYNELAYYYMDSTGSEGINFANKAIEISKIYNQLEEESYAYIMLGSCHIYKSDFDLALDAFFQAEKLAIQLNNTCHLQLIYTNIGIVYRYTDQIELSIDYNSKALDNAIQCGDLAGIIQTYISIGNTYALLEDYYNSLKYFEKAINEIEGKDTLKTSLAGLYNNIGYIQYMNENYIKAEESYLNAYNVFDEIHNFQGMGLCLTNIAQIHILNNNFETAEEYINKADSLHKLNDFKESRKNLYYTAYELFYNQSKYQTAIYYLQEYQKLKDTIYSEKLDQEILELKTKYEVEKLEADSKSKQQRIDNQKKINIIYIITISTILFIVVFLIIIYKQKKNLNKQLKIQNNLLKLKDDEINDNLLYARKIQLANIDLENIPNNIKIYDKPKSIVGGDFYLITQREDCKYIVLGDATGHGVSGGFLSTISTHIINNALNKFTDLPEIMNYLNYSFYYYLNKSNSLSGESLAITIIKLSDTKLEYTGSKHKIWLLSNNSQEIQEVKTNPNIIGQEQNVKFTSAEIILKKDDFIFISSDGFADQFGSKHKGKYKYKRFRELLKSFNTNNFSDLSFILEKELNEWRGDNEQTDDILVIGIKI